MKITREYLLSLSPQPCESGLASFDAAFPDGLLVEGEPDEEMIGKLATLDLTRFADTLPPEPRAAYRRAEAEAGAAYRRATAEAGAAYNQATAEAWAAYDRAKAEGWAAWARAAVEAWAAYRRARAEALWRIVADTEES